MPNKKEILITGASSELMQIFIPLIDRDKYEIFGLTRNKINIQNAHIKIVEGDMCDFATMNSSIPRCSMIIHAAALTHSFNAKSYYAVNFNATRHLVDMAKQRKVEKFVFISSRSAGSKNGAYGVSKFLAEQKIKQTLNNWLIFRPAEIYGIRKNKGIEKLINDVLKKKTLLCPMNLSSRLFPIHVKDTAHIMHDYIFNKDLNNKTVTINGQEGFSYQEIIQYICCISGKKINIIPIPKFVMFAIKWLIEILRINIGIAPDQIPRLYGNKQIEELNYNLINLGDYINQKLNQSAQAGES